MSIVSFDDILLAQDRIRSVVRQTPVLTHTLLDERSGASIFVKAECLQVTGSFKIRGAMNRLSQIPETAKAQGVVAFSSGNHAQGVARAARILKMPALIVMPSDAPDVKVAGVRADDTEIRFYDRETESREDIADAIAEAYGSIVVPSFEDVDVIAGQGTVGLEFHHQLPEGGKALDALFCCAGGGGLICGIATALERLSPDTKVFAVEPNGHDDWKRSLEAGSIQTNAAGTRSMCDAILTPQPGELTFSIGRRLLAGGVSVSDVDVAEAIRFAVKYLKIVPEPGGAVALAHVLKGLPNEWRGKQVGVVVTGGNIDEAMLAGLLDSDRA